MAHLYAQEISNIPGCPSAHFPPDNLIGWRWTNSPLTRGCFLPVALIDPRRALSGSDLKKCSCWALSMFETRAQASARHAMLSATIPNFSRNVGDHVSMVTLNQGDGVVGPIGRYGHFDFHPSDTFDAMNRFVVVGPV